MGLRETKKAETRRRISDIATALFLARGFDAVTVTEVAEAAGVAKMTVFNYFSRKEELLFDRVDEARALLDTALAAFPAASPASIVRRLARQLVADRHPFAKFTAGVLTFWRVVEASPALVAHVRELRDGLEAELATRLAAAIGAPRDDARAAMVAAMLVAAWRIAYAAALGRHRAGARSDAVTALFLERLDRALDMLGAAIAGTPYAGAAEDPPVTQAGKRVRLHRRGRSRRREPSRIIVIGNGQT